MHSQAVRTQIKNPTTLVLIDSNRSIYENEDIIDPLMIKFIQMLQMETNNFYFLFHHKNVKKNHEKCGLFIQRCQTFKIVIETQIIETQNIFETMTDKIQEILVKEKQTSHSPSHLKQNGTSHQSSKDRIIIITHNPGKINCPKLTKYLNDQNYINTTDIYYFYYSSYLQNLQKKETIENHFYKNSFGRQQQSLQFFHISHLLQVLPHLVEKFKQHRVTVGYYFYYKKQSELLSNGVLLDSSLVNLVPVDMRYYNQTQYNFLKVFFHRVFDLNKTNEIKMDLNEIELFKQNYDRFIKEIQIKNIDPIHMIPIIAQRIQFSNVFDGILQSERALQIMKQSGIKIRTPKFHEISNTSIQDVNIKYHFPSIVKTKAAAFTPNCHTMAIVINSQGLKNILELDDFKCDLMLQEIVNHDGVIYKVYCIGPNVIVQKRRSIPNIEESNFKQCYSIFDSQKDLFKQVCECVINITEPVLDSQPQDLIFKELFQGLSEMIREHFQMELFGFDIIVNAETRDLNIIDINHFPGYKNVANIKEMFDKLFTQ